MNENKNSYVLLIVGRVEQYTNSIDKRIIKIGYYSANQKKWHLIRSVDLKIEISRLASFVCSNTHLYVFDMFKDKSPRMINLKTFTISLLPRMNVLRMSVGAVFWNGLVYTIGGTDINLYQHSNVVEW